MGVDGRDGTKSDHDSQCDDVERKLGDDETCSAAVASIGMEFLIAEKNDKSCSQRSCEHGKNNLPRKDNKSRKSSNEKSEDFLRKRHFVVNKFVFCFFFLACVRQHINNIRRSPLGKRIGSEENERTIKVMEHGRLFEPKTISRLKLNDAGKIRLQNREKK